MEHHEETRKKIVAIARKIFSHFGFKKTTMEEIAQASRKGKSSIYYYFSSKEEIFDAVIRKEADELKEELKKELAVESDPVKKLMIYIEVRMKRMARMKNLVAALRSEHLSHFDFIEKVRTDYNNQEIEALSAIIEGGIESGQFDVEDSELSAIVIVTAMKGLEVPLFLARKRGHNFDSSLDSLVNHLFYGIIKR